MTQQYLVGELSLLLGQLQTVVTNQAFVGDIVRLRREAEALPPTALSPVAVRALDLIDILCWDAVDRGDMVGFRRQAQVSAELYEFGVCAGLLGQEVP
jgi:hypothetical protein